MTRSQLDAKHKELYGRNPRKDYDDEKVIQLILKKDENFSTEEAPVIDTIEALNEEPKAPPPVKKNPITVVQKGDREPEGVVKQGNTHKVWVNGEVKWWTKNVIEMALNTARAMKARGQEYDIQLPENTEFHTSAEFNKCSNC